MEAVKKAKAVTKKVLLCAYAKVSFRGAKIGNNVKVERPISVKNPKYFSIGDDCYFGHDCRFEAWDQYLNDIFKPIIIFGRDVRINSTCHIGCIDRVEIGDQTLIGSHVMITDHSHGQNSKDELNCHPSERRLYSKGPVIIGKRCWICENAVVLPGVKIGDEAVIAANSVVTKDVPARVVVAGNPAKVVKHI